MIKYIKLPYHLAVVYGLRCFSLGFVTVICCELYLERTTELYESGRKTLFFKKQ